MKSGISFESRSCIIIFPTFLAALCTVLFVWFFFLVLMALMMIQSQKALWDCQIIEISNTVDGFIFVGTNFRGLSLNKNHTFMRFEIRGQGIFLHSSYRKSLFRGYWNSWIRPSTKTTKTGTPRKLSHPQYLYVCRMHCTDVPTFDLSLGIGAKQGQVGILPVVLLRFT